MGEGNAEGYPLAIYNEISEVGKNVPSSKKHVKWIFTFSEHFDEHEVILAHSTISGKKKLFLNGKLLYESRKVASFEWNYGWTMGEHICTCDIKGEGKYDISIDAVPYRLWPRLNEFQAQMKAAKMASRKAYAEDQLHRKLSDEPPPSKSNRKKGGKPHGRRESRKNSTTSSSSQANTSRDSSASQVTPVDKARSKKSTSSTNENPVMIDLLSAEVGGVTPPNAHAPAQAPVLGNNRPFHPFLEASYDQDREMHVQQLGAQFQQLNTGCDAYPVTTASSFLPPPSDNAPIPPIMPHNTELFFQEQQHGSQKERRRDNSLDKDLWQVAAEKDFVNMNDLTGQHKSIKPLSKDQRTLTELANSQKVQRPPQQQTVVMNDPPAELPSGFYVKEQAMMAMQPYGYPPQQAAYYPPQQHHVNPQQQPYAYYQPQPVHVQYVGKSNQQGYQQQN